MIPGYFLSTPSRRRVTFLQLNVCKPLPEKGNLCRKLGLIRVGGMTFLRFFHLNTGPKAISDWSDFHLNIHVCFLLFFGASWRLHWTIESGCLCFLFFFSFYEGSGDANHPGYCSPLCGSVMGPYRTEQISLLIK